MMMAGRFVEGCRRGLKVNGVKSKVEMLGGKRVWCVRLEVAW